MHVRLICLFCRTVEHVLVFLESISLLVGFSHIFCLVRQVLLLRCKARSSWRDNSMAQASFKPVSSKEAFQASFPLSSSQNSALYVSMTSSKAITSRAAPSCRSCKAVMHSVRETTCTRKGSIRRKIVAYLI